MCTEVHIEKAGNMCTDGGHTEIPCILNVQWSPVRTPHLAIAGTISVLHDKRRAPDTRESVAANARQKVARNGTVIVTVTFMVPSNGCQEPMKRNQTLRAN